MKKLRLAPGGYFLLHYYTLADIEPLTRTVLCVARTFLSPLRGSDRAYLLYLFAAEDYFPSTRLISLIRNCVVTVPR